VKSTRAAALPLVLFLFTIGCAGTPGGPGSGPDDTPREVSGTLLADEVWEGEVVVVDDLLVPAGRTLTIRPGTTVRVRRADTSRTEPEFLDNATEVLVRGRIKALGTKAEPILFEPEVASEGGDSPAWAGILFDGGEGKLVHCRISGAERGALIIGASPLLQDVDIRSVRQGIMIHGTSRPLLERVSVEAAEGGVSCWRGSAPRMTGLRVRAGEREGLLAAPGSRPTIVDSTFEGPLAGVLWGSDSPPPPGLEEGSTVNVVPPRPSPAEEAGEGAPPGGEEGARPPGEAREYRGESFIGWDETWEGEIFIDGTVMVAPGATLTIRPDTVVRFAFRDSNGDGIGESEIFIQGRLAAAGNRKQPVVFTAAGEQGPGRWGAVNIMGSDKEDNFLAHAVVESSYRGLHSHFSSFRVENSLFRGNYRGLQFQESTAVVRETVIRGNRSAMRFRDSTVVIEDCRLRGNTSGLQTLRSRISISRCAITGNALAGVHLRETEGVVEGTSFVGNAPGLRATEGRFRLEGNTFSGNSHGGVQLRASIVEARGNLFSGNAGNGLSVDSPSIVLRDNVFEGNLRFALENNSPLGVDALYNYWGVAPGGIPDLLFDGGDDSSLGLVNYDPPLTVRPSLPPSP